MSSSHNRTISSSFVQAVVAKLALPHRQLSDLLQHCDISESVLNSNRARVRPAQFARLLDAATQLSNDESLGYNKTPQRIGHGCAGSLLSPQ